MTLEGQSSQNEKFSHCISYVCSPVTALPQSLESLEWCLPALLLEIYLPAGLSPNIKCFFLVIPFRIPCNLYYAAFFPPVSFICLCVQVTCLALLISSSAEAQSVWTPLSSVMEKRTVRMGQMRAGPVPLIHALINLGVHKTATAHPQEQ